MSDQIQAIAGRLAAMREIMGFSEQEMADSLNIPEDEYKAYEAGQNDFSFSMLYGAANKLGVDIVDLLTGDTPRLNQMSLVRKGEGLNIERRSEYKYQHLAFFFRNKHAEPFKVLVEPGDKEMHLNTHEGQEFNYILDGSMEIQVGERKETVQAGDAVYYDSSCPHGMVAVGDKACEFLAIIIK